MKSEPVEKSRKRRRQKAIVRPNPRKCLLGGKLGDACEVSDTETFENLSATEFACPTAQGALDVFGGKRDGNCFGRRDDLL